MPRKFWLDTTLGGIATQMTNFGKKITSYKTPLGLATLQVTNIVAVCDAYVEAFNAWSSAGRRCRL